MTKNKQREAAFIGVAAFFAVLILAAYTWGVFALTGYFNRLTESSTYREGGISFDIERAKKIKLGSE